MENVGLFCVHGFMEDGTTSFMYLVKYLHANGINNVYTTNLQGHNPEDDFSSFNYKKCLKQVETEYKEYKKHYEKVFLVGFSMGGVIASHLASKFGADKLVMISPAFKYGRGSQVVKDIAKLIQNPEISFRDLLRKDRENRWKAVREFIELEFAERGTSYENFVDRLSRASISSFINFARLVGTIKRRVKIKDIPVRLYLAERDELVPISSGLYIFNKLDTENKRVVILGNVHHRILASSHKYDVSEEIYHFLYSDIMARKTLIT